jgi:hypothetical protein
LFPRTPGDVEDLDVGADLLRAPSKLLSVKARHAGSGTQEALAILKDNPLGDQL